MTALANGDGKRLLLAESDPTWLGILRHVLAEAGYQVETATEGVQCLDKLRAGNCQVLVLDTDLFWASRSDINALRAPTQIPNIPVVLLSDNIFSDMLFRVIDVPVVKWLRKPVTSAALLASVREATERAV